MKNYSIPISQNYIKSTNGIISTHLLWTMSKDQTFIHWLLLIPIKSKKLLELFIKFLMVWSIFIVWTLFIMISSLKTCFMILRLKLSKLLILGRLFKWIPLLKSYWDKEEPFHILLLNIFKIFVQEKWTFGHVDWSCITFWTALFTFTTKTEKKCVKKLSQNQFSFKVNFLFY